MKVLYNPNDWPKGHPLEGLRRSKSSDIRGFDLMQLEGILVKQWITQKHCLIQEEIVAVAIYSVKIFLNDTKANSLYSMTSLVLSN